MIELFIQFDYGKSAVLHREAFPLPSGPAKPKVYPHARLLVVDDDENNRDMISRRLIRRGFDVVIAVDGFDALRTIGLSNPPAAEPAELSCEFDLILLDIEMPGTSMSSPPKRLGSAASKRTSACVSSK